MITYGMAGISQPQVVDTSVDRITEGTATGEPTDSLGRLASFGVNVQRGDAPQ